MTDHNFKTLIQNLKENKLLWAYFDKLLMESPINLLDDTHSFEEKMLAMVSIPESVKVDLAVRMLKEIEIGRGHS